MLTLIADKSLIDLHMEAMAVAVDDSDEEMASKIKTISELNIEKEQPKNV